MCLPAPKVANVPGVANVRWPARLQGHDRVVNPDWKQDGGALLAFPVQGGFHLLLYPLARHGCLGEDEQQLVIDADGFINPRAEAVTDFHIFRSKPAAHTLVLKICVEAFGKSAVLARIADEAGVELEGLIEERGQIVNQRVWQATTSKKGQGKWPGLGEGAMVESTGAVMLAGL